MWPSNKGEGSEDSYQGTTFYSIYYNGIKWCLPMSREYGVGQHVPPNNIPVPQEPKIEIIYVIGNKCMASYIHTRKEEN